MKKEISQSALNNFKLYSMVSAGPLASYIGFTEEEVKQYCLENGYTLDAQRFVDFYECKGWMVGKNKMKNWKAAVRTWARKDQGGVRDEPEPTNSIRLW